MDSFNKQQQKKQGNYVSIRIKKMAYLEDFRGKCGRNPTIYLQDNIRKHAARRPPIFSERIALSMA
jgi:hypothetical protein